MKALEWVIVTSKRLAIISPTLYRRFFKKPMVIAVGDSWFNLTLFNFRIYPIDTLDWLKRLGLNIVDGAIPGYKVSSESKYKLYKSYVKYTNQKYNLFLLSLGGNDIVFGSFNKTIIGSGDEAELDTKMMRVVLKELISEISEYINTVTEEFKKHNKDVIFIIHGYDYIRADTKTLSIYDGSLTNILEKRDITDKKGNEILKKVLDIYNSELSKFAKSVENVHHVDLINTLEDSKWVEDIHPDPKGYYRIASKIYNYIKNNINVKYYK